MRHHFSRSGLVWGTLLLVSCGGSLAHYKPAPDDEGAALDPLDDTTDDGPHIAQNTGDDDDDDTGPGTTPTDPGPDCTTKADCDDPQCGSVCDADGDGEITEDLGGRDCDDTDRDIHPGAFDACDRVDNDCDGAIDEDNDRDGFDVCDDCDDEDRAVNPDHADPCDGFDANCDGEDCAPWEEDFEGAGIPAVFAKTGQGNWHVDPDWHHRGTQCGMSGAIGNGETTVLTLTVDITSAGTATFWHRGSTEQGYDKFRFKIDGVQQGIWSGTWSWTQESYPLSLGIHDLEWSYTKDNTLSDGTDQVGIDDLVIEGGRPL